MQQGIREHGEGKERRAARRVTSRRRVFLASLVFFAGCSSAFHTASTPEDGGPVPLEDSGLAMVPDEGTGLEGGALEDALSAPQNLAAVHAAPGLPPFRLCFATAPAERVIAMLPIPPVPETASPSPDVPPIGGYPGVASGTPGLFPGAAAVLPLLPDFSQSSVRPFVVLTSSLTAEAAEAGADGGAEPTCDALLGRHGLGPIDVPTPGLLKPGVDFWQLPTFSPGAFAAGATYLLSVVGCVPSVETPPGVPAPDAGEDAGIDDAASDDAASDDATVPGNLDAGAGAAPDATAPAPPPVSSCGAGYDGGVNLSMGIARLDTAPIGDAGVLGVQFAHRASALEAPVASEADASVHAPATDGVVPAFFHAVPSGGGLVYAATPVVLPDGGGITVTFSPSGIAPGKAYPATLNLSDPSLEFGAYLASPDGSAVQYSAYPTGDVLALPLRSIASLSGSALDGGFAQGATYTFVLLGDPAEAPAFLANPDGGILPVTNASYDGRGLHVVAVPNVFSPPAP